MTQGPQPVTPSLGERLLEIYAAHTLYEFAAEWPVSVNRRLTGAFRRSVKTTIYQREVGKACLVARMRARQPVIVGLVGVCITLYPAAKSRLDIDNGVKSILDGMKGVAYLDDRQVEPLLVVRAPGFHREAHVVVRIAV